MVPGIELDELGNEPAAVDDTNIVTTYSSDLALSTTPGFDAVHVVKGAAIAPVPAACAGRATTTAAVKARAESVIRIGVMVSLFHERPSPKRRLICFGSKM